MNILDIGWEENAAWALGGHGQVCANEELESIDKDTKLVEMDEWELESR